MMNFIIRPESIIMGFLMGFFKQEHLHQGVPNAFKYVDNRQEGSLQIAMAEDDQLIVPAPGIIIQEGGFNENIRAFGNDANGEELLFLDRRHISNFLHPLTLHCLGRKKGEAKFLQSIVARAIISFRKAIYEMGVTQISNVQGSPPQRISETQSENASQLYDCTLMFQMSMDQHWILSRQEYGDEVYLEELISFKVLSALNELEFDESGNPIDDPQGIFQLEFSV